MSKALLLVTLVVFSVFAVEGGVAAHAETYAFDAALSLTGDCSTSTADPVPDPSCPGGTHPPAPFEGPKSIATDAYGNIYVASYGLGEPFGAQGRIDIFDSGGVYITEIDAPGGPSNLAVDSKGNLYVFYFVSSSTEEIMLYEPTLYKPAEGKISYEASPKLVAKAEGSFFVGLGIDPRNDHLFANLAVHIVEFGSAAEGNKVLDGTIGEGTISNFHGVGLAIDAAHKRIYASDSHKVRVFDLESPHELLMTIEASAVPGLEKFENSLSVAADEGTGHFFIYDGGGTNAVYEFSLGGTYLATIKHGIQHVPGAEISIDNGKNSPNGALNPIGRYLFVPSKPSGTGHSFAFGPEQAKEAPKVVSASFAGVTNSEAELKAEINPGNLETDYTVEYSAEEGFGEAVVAAEGSIPAGSAPVEVSAPVEGLEPGTTYYFRVVAENEKGVDEVESVFATYPVEEVEPTLCPNKALRVGPSALLPDCRAYELVTPPDTNGRAPLGVGHLGTYFPTREASPDGNAASFQIEGGSIPGFEGTGSYAGDPYLAKRTESGWSTEYTGPTAEESPALLPGSNSPDQGYSFWSTAGGNDGTVPGGGSAQIEGKPTAYVRYPDGHSALVGRGELGIDPVAEGRLISENGGHIIFVSGNISGPAIQLEENAPPDGTRTIYDRTADEVTHVVSLLPENETPKEGENAFFEGASLDGSGVAFRIGEGTVPSGPLYFRYENQETYEVAGAGATFAGFSEGAERIFYVEGGDLFAYEVGGTENPIAFSTSSDVTPVNVSSDGTVAYFVSPSVLGGENPEGASAQPGNENLYRSQEGQISFVGTVTEEDVLGEESGIGLGLWAPHVVSYGEAAEDPSRTTSDGQVLLFESEASLTDGKTSGHTEVYRYDFSRSELSCLSCDPTSASATGEATLQSASLEQGAPEPLGFFASVANLRSDGRRAFFQSTEPLVAGDTDELQDVYEWEDNGVGSCHHEGGCVYLISSGHSSRIDYLWAVSDSGDDVFFRSSDLLVGSDPDATPSIYDARVGGGFAEETANVCEGEGCRPALLAPPSMLSPESGVHPSSPEVKNPCPKGKRKVIRNGKTVCVKKKHKKHKHRRKAGNKRKGAGR